MGATLLGIPGLHHPLWAGVPHACFESSRFPCSQTMHLVGKANQEFTSCHCGNLETSLRTQSQGSPLPLPWAPPGLLLPRPSLPISGLLPLASLTHSSAVLPSFLLLLLTALFHFRDENNSAQVWGMTSASPQRSLDPWTWGLVGRTVQQ